MNRYEAENAVYNVDGYFIPRPLEPREAAFKRAKAECLVHLRRRILIIEELSLEQFDSEQRAWRRQPECSQSAKAGVANE